MGNVCCGMQAQYKAAVGQGGSLLCMGGCQEIFASVRRGLAAM